ncbi:FAS-associated factor 2, partial [Nowakowskiella sp. JEL0078]
MDQLDSLSDDQKSVLQTFQAVTGIDDINKIIQTLSSHNWNLESAVQNTLEERFEDFQENQSSSSSSTPLLNENRSTAPNRTPSSSPLSPAGAVQRQNQSLISLLLFPFTVGIQLFSGIVSYALSFFPFFGTAPRAPAGTSASRRRANAEGARDPQAAAARFLLDFESAFGRVHPPFFQGTYQQAIDLAKREIRYCLVYLHAEEHDDTESFCRQTLASEQFSAWIQERNIIIWAGDIRESEAFKVSSLLMTTSYPFLAFIAHQGSRPASVIDRFEGNKTPEQLIAIISQHIDRLDPQLAAVRAERTRNAQARSIREQQDEAYQQSLRADQEKVRKAKEEKERLEKEKAEEERQENERKNLLETKMERKIRLRENMPLEPDSSESEVTKLSLRLPNGERLIRKFLA